MSALEPLPRADRRGARRRLALRRPARDAGRQRSCARCSSRRRRDPARDASRVADGRVPSIVDLAPAAGWDEREAHDLYGVGFDGHEPLRPLVDHDPELDRWTVPVRGDDPYQVAVGPIHAGVIESGHFRFHVVGDRILHLDARLFYKHRGLERAAEGETLDEGLAVRRARLRGLRGRERASPTRTPARTRSASRPTAELARARTILLELERIWNHLNDIAAVCAGVGLAAGNNRFAALTERARRLNAPLTGHRFLFGIGRASAAATSPSTRRASEPRATSSRAFARDSARGWRELLFNASFQDRLPDIGVVTRGERRAARRRRAGGARGGRRRGRPRDRSPRLAYDGFDAGRPRARRRRRPGAARAARARAAADASTSSTRLLDRPVAARRRASRRGTSARSASAASRARAARRRCIVERDGDRVGRLRLRTGSYANWPVVAHAAADNLLPDFPLINKSFELCYACVDR